MKPKTPPDYVIAREALAKMRPIEEIARGLDLPTSGPSFFSYGGLYAKVSHKLARHSAEDRGGKPILVTAMTPIPAGSGKTLTSITLADSLDRILRERAGGRRASFVLRQPSQGPTLGMKGGACGGGYSQVLPMEDINLQFTGDIPAVTQAHNLLWAMLMAYMDPPGRRKEVDPETIEWTRVVDLCDRSVRRFRICPDGRMDEKSHIFEGRANITAASEVMAVLGLAADMEDLHRRLARIRVARHKEDRSPVTAETLGVVGAMQTVLKHALNPNLVQTLAGTGGFIHTGPFANIAHGNSSLIGLLLACRHADYVVTEAGFGAELGAQKFFDVVCRLTGKGPAATVLVCSLRELKYQGGAEPLPEDKPPGGKWQFAPDREAYRKGIENLKVHVENLRRYGVKVVVAVNRFGNDDPDEMADCVAEIQEQTGAPAIPHTGYRDGVTGGLELAQKVLDEIEAPGEPEPFQLLYEDEAPLREKIEAVATRIYRAAGVDYDPIAERDLEEIEATYGSGLNVVLSKTQFSLSEDKKLRGVPLNRRMKVNRVLFRGGAGWVTVILGGVLLMPGMIYESCAARQLSPEACEEVFGGYVIENLS